MRVLARLFLFVGVYFLLMVFAELLKMPQQMTSYMVIGYLASLITARVLDGK